ncbi:MAG: hypothetical protein AB7F65_06735 [Dehalococcoidia bacterium]
MDVLRSMGLQAPRDYADRVLRAFETAPPHASAQIVAVAAVRGLGRPRNGLSKCAIARRLVHALRIRGRANRPTQPMRSPTARGLEERQDAPTRRKQRLDLSAELGEFAKHVERDQIDQFWVARGKGQLREAPELYAQGLLAAFLARPGARPEVFREVRAGTGFVDILVRRRNSDHVVELKVLRRGGITGAKQVTAYAKLYGHSEAWLVVLDARRPPRRQLSRRDRIVEGVIVHVVVIDINPPAPSSLG